VRSRPMRSAMLLLLIAALLGGCTFGTQLKTETADPKAIAGTYDLYLYGCRYPDDLEHAAFLVAPEKAGMVAFFVMDSSLKITRGLPADKALAEANTFVRCGNRTVESLRIHRIPDGTGGTLGYEMLPRFPDTDVGGSDPLFVNFSLKDGKINVYIQLNPYVERQLNMQNGPGAGGP
jgi:hypothetical protein